MGLDICYGVGWGGTVKNTSIWRLNNMLLSSQEVPEEINE